MTSDDSSALPVTGGTSTKTMLLCALVGAVSGMLASLASPAAGLLILVGLLISLVLTSLLYPMIGLALILISAVVSGYSIEIGAHGIGFAAYAESVTNVAVSLRVEHIVVPLCTFALLLRIIIQRVPLVLGRARWLFLLIFLNITSTIVRSPNPLYSFRMLYFYLIGLSIYLYVINCVRTPDQLRAALKVYVTVAVAEALFALTVGGHWHDRGVLRLHGSLLEPTVFGIYGTLMTITGLSWGVWKWHSHRLPYVVGIGCGLVIVVTLLTFSRAAWGGLMLGIVALLGYWRRWRLRGSKKLVLLGSVAIMAVLCLILVWFLVDSELVGRVRQSSLFGRAVYTSYLTRYRSMLQVLTEASRHPILGHGTLAYGLKHGVFEQEYLAEQHGWIMSGLLLMLYDTGVLGALLYLLFVGMLFCDAYRATKSSDSFLRIMGASALVGTAVWFILDQFTTSVTLGLTWCYLGLASTTPRVIRNPTTDLEDASEAP